MIRCFAEYLYWFTGVLICRCLGGKKFDDGLRFSDGKIMVCLFALPHSFSPRISLACGGYLRIIILYGRSSPQQALLAIFPLDLSPIAMIG
ncbi:hypothetical protein V6N12_010814 [Hibiscus sabdariffa]|uniref:Uncharacterized protein n=1 Tax=Hibiscus sabdariffa TaxID=183260 RepID=A0ABR2EMZ1_9ROSI